MTVKFIEKRAGQISDQLNDLRDKLKNLLYEMERQQPYDEHIPMIAIEQMRSAAVDMHSAIDKLDECKQLS